MSADRTAIDLYWLPLGAGGRSVRLNGRLFEAVAAALGRRRACDLYHSALEARVPEGRFVIEMAPIPVDDAPGRGVVAEGAVGAGVARRLRLFRYEVRCWRDGVIPDVAEAVESPRRLSDDPDCARRLLELVPHVPTPVWGRDELRTGEMWNSNSLDLVAYRPLRPRHRADQPSDRGTGARLAGRHRCGATPAEHAGRSHVATADRRGREMKTTRLTHSGLTVGSIAAAALVYRSLLRRRIMNWGATDAEVDARLPGDELLEHADGVATRAITVDAAASAVWPWIAQMGPLPRGGAYTYDWIENLLGLDMHSADRVLPDYQHPRVGDTLGYGKNRMRFERVEPRRVLATRSEDGNWVWSFVLEEQDGKTRLISRNRFRLPSLTARIGMLPMEPASLVMERKMLHGIKQRAERLAAEGREASHV